jgi:hypothetical protein
MTLPSLRTDQLFPGWFLYVDTPTPVRLWSGARTFVMGANGPDGTGGAYLGFGRLLSIPSLVIPVNGAFVQHVFTVSGVDARAVRLMNADRDALRGARVSFGRLELKPDGTPNGDLNWLWQGFCDGPTMNRNGRSNPVTYTIGLKVSAGSVSRKRRRIAYYTPSQQAERDPSDTAMNNVPTYAEGTLVTWPLP